MSAPRALLDSNVIVAALAVQHQHHTASLALFDDGAGGFAVAAHSLAEAYSTLTRQGGPAPYGMAPTEAAAALDSLRAVTSLIGLTPGQSYEVIQDYAAQGGVGPRLYDALIGACARVHAIGTIVTWNVGHMATLFPELTVVPPSDFRSRANAFRRDRPSG